MLRIAQPIMAKGPSSQIAMFQMNGIVQNLFSDKFRRTIISAFHQRWKSSDTGLVTCVNMVKSICDEIKLEESISFFAVYLPFLHSMTCLADCIGDLPTFWIVDNIGVVRDICYSTIALSILQHPGQTLSTITENIPTACSIVLTYLLRMTPELLQSMRASVLQYQQPALEVYSKLDLTMIHQ